MSDKPEHAGTKRGRRAKERADAKAAAKKIGGRRAAQRAPVVDDASCTVGDLKCFICMDGPEDRDDELELAPRNLYQLHYTFFAIGLSFCGSCPGS